MTNQALLDPLGRFAMKHRWLLLVAVIAMNILSACTIVRYADETKSLTIADLRITGSAIDLSAALEGKGSVQVNREQGSAVDAIAEAVSR